jgi:hypothetical protein
MFGWERNTAWLILVDLPTTRPIHNGVVAGLFSFLFLVYFDDLHLTVLDLQLFSSVARARASRPI